MGWRIRARFPGEFVPDLPWFVYAVLLAPARLILVAAV